MLVRIQEEKEPSYTVGGNLNWGNHYGNHYGGSSKNLKELPYNRTVMPLLAYM
jgi:hypothetical protein